MLFPSHSSLAGMKCLDDFIIMLSSYKFPMLFSSISSCVIIIDLYGREKNMHRIIGNNLQYLLENIRPNNEFIASLLSLNCVTEEQSCFIRRQRSHRNKNTELLHVVRSFDKTKSSNLVRCLRRTSQEIVAKIFEYGGG